MNHSVASHTRRAELRVLRAVTVSALALASLAACGSSSDGSVVDGGPHAGSSGADATASGSSGSDDAQASDDTGASHSADGAPPGIGGDGGTPNDAGVALTNPAPASKFFVGANFWNIDWEGQSDFFVPNVDFATTTNPWQPALLTDLAPYSVLRFMDWNQTNDSNNVQAVWSTRKQKTAAQSEPVAFEWQIDLCNRTKKDYWLNVPHEATADMWKKLAELVHDQLDPNLRVYLEWSNEVWNSGFPQNAYAAAQARTLKLPGATPAIAYQVYESVRMFETFEGVFGAGSPRVVKVIAGQAAWTGPCTDEMAAFGDATINPKDTRADAYAIAPYVSGTSISALTASLPQITQWTKDSVTCGLTGNLPLISYEGGSDSFSAPNNGCTTLQHDPGMLDLYKSYLDDVSGAKLSGPFMQYTHTGACWGLKEKTGDSLATSPKYKGLLDWLAAHP